MARLPRPASNSGDVITAVNGQSIKDARELARIIGALAPGNAVKLDVLHKGKDAVVNLTLGKLPNAQEAKAGSGGGDPTHGTDVPHLGMTVAPANSVAGTAKTGVVDWRRPEWSSFGSRL